jgi:hypothetical protein
MAHSEIRSGRELEMGLVYPRMDASVRATDSLVFTILLQWVIMIGAARLLNRGFRRRG